MDKPITIPALDKNGTPTEKLPDCPNCGTDELYVPPFHRGTAEVKCYLCGWFQIDFQGKS